MLTSAAIGLALLALSGGRYERIGRYILFALDAAAISGTLAFAPLSSGGHVPQNLVFLSTRTEYFFVIVAVSVIALSPMPVLWTGFCGVIGLAGATSWIIAGMERIVTVRDLPPSPSRAEYLGIMLDPDFLVVAFRVRWPPSFSAAKRPRT
jgi:adenylate cyclase